MIEDILISGRQRDLGDGFVVSRVLPSPKKRMVGPFIFLDRMGPVEVGPGKTNLDVRPHPHIGLSTATFLLKGKGLHRDSLGTEMILQPGDLNWMTAGSGIVHSERTPEAERKINQTFDGLQLWVALPVDFEDVDPSFQHHPKETIPQINADGLKGSVLIGEWKGQQSPVQTYSPTLFVELNATEDLDRHFSFSYDEVCVYLLEGSLKVNNQKLDVGDMLVIGNPHSLSLKASAGSHFVFLGGQPFPEPRHIFWNFVSSSKEKIEEAADKWEQQLYPPVPGETEWIPLPPRPTN